MPEFEYIVDWYKQGYNHIGENIPKFKDWIRLNEASRPLDVILFYSSPTKKVVSHLGIYIGDDKFVHISTLYNSRVDRLNDHWMNRIYAILRCPNIG